MSRCRMQDISLSEPPNPPGSGFRAAHALLHRLEIVPRSITIRHNMGATCGLSLIHVKSAVPDVGDAGHRAPAASLAVLTKPSNAEVACVRAPCLRREASMRRPPRHLAPFRSFQRPFAAQKIVGVPVRNDR